jgi:chemotaxis response regulator CheB
VLFEDGSPLSRPQWFRTISNKSLYDARDTTRCLLDAGGWGISQTRLQSWFRRATLVSPVKSKNRKKVLEAIRKRPNRKARNLQRLRPQMSAGRTQKSDDQLQPEGRTPNHFPLVGIGATAGGLEAFPRLLRVFPQPQRCELEEQRSH